MKNIILLLCVYFPFISLAQQTSTIEAPIGLLRAQPEITSQIIFRVEEKAKVSYRHDKMLLVGYITSQTLGAKTDIITASTETKKQ